MMQNRKIVFIMTDSQRWDMVGCYRDTGLKTPNIDRLAENGLRFERAYTTQPVCQAARAGIFTGQYPHSCAAWANSMGISDNTKTLGQRLSDHGVHTAYIGKWHLDGGDYFGAGVCPPGWDEAYWYDMRRYLEELTDDQRLLSRDTDSMKDQEFPVELTYGRRCADKAIRFIENHGEEDFFLAVSFDEPHHPFMCPEPYASMYKDFVFPKSPNVYDTLENKPDHQRVWAGDSLRQDKDAIEIRQRFFFGCNSFVDSEIGRILDVIEKTVPDALVIYTTDHGCFQHSHSLQGKGPAAYDEIARVPMIYAGPGIPKGIVSAHPASHIDITPTVLELMGAGIPKTIEGKSIAAELADPSLRTNAHVFIEFGRFEVDHDTFGGFQPMRSVFDGRHKLTINLLTSDELYDMERGPDEMDNLILDPGHTAIRDSLHDVLLNHMNETRDPFRGYYWERRPWRTDAKPAAWRYTGMTRQREEDEQYEKRQLDYDTGLPMTEAVRKK
jgi:uncharacterized sulfatase